MTSALFTQQTAPGWAVTADALDPEEIAAFARSLDLPRALAALLLCRGFLTPEAARRFLSPAAAQLHEPARMHGLPVAVGRIRAALLAGEPILIYGDYDVDGTVATVLLKTAMKRAARSLGVQADVRYHVPHRLREGYGMRPARLAEVAAEGVRLVVSVDTGIRAFAAADEAARLGLDLIITDHHLPEGAGVPRALAVLNPNQPGCDYPYKELCGAAVAFKLAHALLEDAARSPEERARLREKLLPSFLKLLAIATVADAVPLTGENRVIAALGLQALRQPAQAGLRALMELSGIDCNRPISATDVGFRLGPRINAAGRMDVASDVVEMLVTRDAAVARSLAEKLHTLNDERRAVEAKALEEIERRLETAAAAGLPPCLVLDDALAAPWHRGVVGILASRVVERTQRPALVLTHEDGEAHGSGRSVAGFHLLDALTEAHRSCDPPLFLRFGGHAHAAGFALRSERVPELRHLLETLAGEAVFETVAPCQCDVRLDLAELTPAFFAAYQQLEPFGHGHPEPVFFAGPVRLCSPPRVFAERHLALQFADPGSGRSFRATAWGRRTPWVERARTEAWAAGMHFLLSFRLRLNTHPDFGGWELDIVEARPQPA